jgi:hypothetical protein
LSASDAGSKAPDRMSDFAAVHERLKAILTSYASDELVVTKEGPAGMALEIRGLEGKPWGYVGGTRLGKSYVSFYLMPIDADPSLGSTISPDLAKRRQGKACFNFTRVDEPLLSQLADLTARAIPGFTERAPAIGASRR